MGRARARRTAPSLPRAVGRAAECGCVVRAASPRPAGDLSERCMQRPACPSVRGHLPSALITRPATNTVPTVGGAAFGGGHRTLSLRVALPQGPTLREQPQ